MRFRTASVLFGTLIVLPLLNAQVERASIVGNITDKSGAPMPGVEISVTNDGTNATIRIASDESGGFTAVNLIPGSYTVAASRTGFRPVTFRNFVLQVGQTARLDITMEVGTVEQTVEVTGTLPLLQTENASVGQVIEQGAVNAYRSTAGTLFNWRSLPQESQVSTMHNRARSTRAEGPTSCDPAGQRFRRMARSANRIRFCWTASTTPR